VQEPHLYSSHSLRRGGATHAAEQGVTRRTIKALGRWRSDFVDPYMSCGAAEAMEASRQLLRVC
jgi:hypothetical protein